MFGFLSTRNFRKFNCKKFLSSVNSIKIELKLTMPDSNLKTISIDETMRLSDIETEVKKNSFVQKMEFKSWDYCEISKQNEIKHCLEHPLYAKIDKMEWQMLNNSISNGEIQEYLNFIKEIKHESGDKFESLKHKQIIYQDYKDIEAKLKQILTKFDKSITDEKVFEIALRLYSMKNFYVNEKDGKHIDNNLNEIFEDYYNSKEELDKMNLMKLKFEKRAKFNAKLYILIAPLMFLIELILIYYGTFQMFSWDIVEPMTYLLSILNLIGILIIRRRIGNDTAHQYYSKNFFRKYLKKGNFDMKKYDLINKKVENYENNLN